MILSDETLDTLLNGKLRIIQKRKGYRFSLDAVVLSNFVRVSDDERVVELGTGSGIISLLLACRCMHMKIIGIEIQPELVDMATKNVQLNELQERVEIIQCDIRRPETCFKPGTFDVVIFNPPYRKIRSGRINLDRQKAIARHEITGTIGDFCSAGAYLLRRGGRCYMIYKVRRMAELFSSMRLSGIEPKRMRSFIRGMQRKGNSSLWKEQRVAGKNCS